MQIKYMPILQFSFTSAITQVIAAGTFLWLQIWKGVSITGAPGPFLLDFIF